MNNPTLISVIIPTYNRSVDLEKAIKSVINQTYKNIEIIIVDDNSCDKESAINQLIAEKYKVNTYIRNHISLGASESRNIALRQSTGDLIAYLDDDDEWYVHKLELQKNFLLNNDQYNAVTCSYDVFTNGYKVKESKFKSTQKFDNIYSVNNIGGASMIMVRSDSIKKIGGFDPDLPSCQDWDCWIRLGEFGKIGVITEICMKYNADLKHRITRNIRAKIQGVKKLFCKHKNSMNQYAKKQVLSNICFWKSRNEEVTKKTRFKYLVLACKYTVDKKTKIKYLLSSISRLVR